MTKVWNRNKLWWDKNQNYDMLSHNKIKSQNYENVISNIRHYYDIKAELISAFYVKIMFMHVIISAFILEVWLNIS